MKTISTCEILRRSDEVSETKLSFICAMDKIQNSLQGDLSVIFAYVFCVFIIAFIVQRASQPIKKRK